MRSSGDEAAGQRAKALRLAIVASAFAIGAFFIGAHFLIAGWDAAINKYLRFVVTLSAVLNLNGPSAAVGLILLIIGLIFLIGYFNEQRQQAVKSLTFPPESGSALLVPLRAFVFYDVENQQIKPDRVPGFQSFLQEKLPRQAIVRRAFFRRNEPGTEDLAGALTVIGFALTSTDDLDKNAADRIIMAAVRETLLAVGTERVHFVLITEDTDFVDIVKFIRFMNHRVSVWAQKFDERSHGAFQRAGADVRSFKDYLA